MEEQQSIKKSNKNRTFLDERGQKKLYQASFWEEEGAEKIEVLQPSSGEEKKILTPSSGEDHTPDFLLDALNPRQREAVTFPEIPLFLIGGPGTGKTHTLACRIAYRVLTGEISPESILALTFTNQGVQRIREILLRFLPSEEAHQIWVCTFPLFCLQILLGESGAIQKEELLLLNERDCFELFRREMKDRFQDSSSQEIKSFFRKVNQLKRELYFPEELREDSFVRDIYSGYQRSLERQGAFDREDLILWTLGLLESLPSVRDRYSHRFHAIFVDEYQDINYGQYRLIRLLAPYEKPDLTIAGDPDQAICSFFGADVRYFLHFDQDYHHAKSIYLNDNYRSTAPLIQAAQQMIGRSADLPEGLEIKEPALFLFHGNSEEEEGDFVAYAIEGLVKGKLRLPLSSGESVVMEEAQGLAFSDIAILYPFSTLVSYLEEVLEKWGIPYERPEKTGLFQSGPYRILMSLLRLLAFPRSDFDIERLLKEFCKDYFKEPFFANLEKRARERNRGLWEILETADFLENLNPEERESLLTFKNKFSLLQQETKGLDLPGIVQKAEGIFSLGLPEREFQRALSLVPGEDLKDFLRREALKGRTDSFFTGEPRVKLLPLFAAKDLDFSVVFLLGCEEGLLSFLQDPDRVREGLREQERRLFYMGLNRARKKVFLSSLSRRRSLGKELHPSSFLDEIDPGLLHFIGPFKKGEDEDNTNQLNLF